MNSHETATIAIKENIGIIVANTGFCYERKTCIATLLDNKLKIHFPFPFLFALSDNLTAGLL